MSEQLQLTFDRATSDQGHTSRADNFGGMSLPMTAEEKAIWSAIEPHQGKGSEIQVNALAQRLAMPERRVRQVVSHLVNTHAKPVGSNGNGYYVAVTKDEVEAICASLRHRGIMILLRCARFQRATLHEVFGQAYIEFGENTNG